MLGDDGKNGVGGNLAVVEEVRAVTCHQDLRLLGGVPETID